MSTADAVIEVRSLTKRYGASRGVEDVTVEVRRGQAFAFLGPNGAEKTTTIRTLLDFIRPTSGEVRILGWTLERRVSGCTLASGTCPASLRSTNG